MKKINTKKFFIALTVSFLSIVVFDILLHAIILRKIWFESKAYWLTPEEMNRLVPFGWLSLLITLFFYGLIYTQLNNHGLKHGLQFGFLVGVASASGALGLLTIVSWPTAIVVGMAAQQLVNNLLLGLIFGKLYTKVTQDAVLTAQ